jgi:hypothetical protein
VNVRNADGRKGSERLTYLPPCSYCGKDRTPRRHNAIQPLDQIICRRRGCEKFKGLIKGAAKSSDIIIKVNHYHYGKTVPGRVPQNEAHEMSGSSLPIVGAELPGEMADRKYFKEDTWSLLRTIVEEEPSHAQVPTKTTMTMLGMMQALWQKKRGAYGDSVV